MSLARSDPFSFPADFVWTSARPLELATEGAVLERSQEAVELGESDAVRPFEGVQRTDSLNERGMKGKRRNGNWNRSKALRIDIELTRRSLRPCSESSTSLRTKKRLFNFDPQRTRWMAF